MLATADGDAALGVAGRQGEPLRRLRDQLHEQRAIDAHAVTVDVGAHLLPVRDRLVVSKVDADLFEDSHRGIVDTLDALLVEHFVIGQREFERRQHRCGCSDPRAVPGRAAAAPGSASSHGIHVCAPDRTGRDLPTAAAAAAYTPNSRCRLRRRPDSASLAPRASQRVDNDMIPSYDTSPIARIRRTGDCDDEPVHHRYAHR